jgi:DNA-binding CsgD family transcriptional regulator
VTIPSGEIKTFEVTANPIRDVKGAISSCLETVQDITERKQAEERLSKANEELNSKNAALQEVLRHIEDEKLELTEKIMANIEATILPSLERFKNNTSGTVGSEYLSDLEKNMKDLTSSFGLQMKNSQDSLTAREAEICNMIRIGHSNKEISSLLSISIFTVVAHRRKIRKKLSLTNRPVNLTTHLKNIR